MPVRLALALAASLAALAPSGARAGSPFYGAIRVGALVPTQLSGFGTGFAVEAGAGWWVTPHLTLELAAGRKSLTGPGGFSSVATALPVDATLTLFPITATARWAFWAGSWRPYVLAGGGAEVTRVRPVEAVAGRGPLSTSWTRAAPLGQAGAGLVYQADEHLALGAEARYVVARAHQGGEVAADGLQAQATAEYRY
ncbi:MAG: outer membrane beta-barrel protein [Anaeromyxobacteraceae bacterium]